MNILTKNKKLFEKELKLVDKKILSLGNNRPDLIKMLLQHIISAGGKRLRPIIVILTAKMLGGKGSKIVNMACCVELLHTATLFHDDVVDGSKLRRGRKTANELWGNSASVLVGDFLLAEAFKIMSDCESLEIIEILSRTSSIITEGEIKQLMYKADITTSLEEYINIITSKTAELFSACASVGAVIANMDKKTKINSANFGRNLGIAFQITDDNLDYFADENNWGKNLGDDFREGKATLPAIYTYSKIADKNYKKHLENLFLIDEENRNQKEFKEFLGNMKKYDAYEFSRNFAVEYAENARKSLAKMPENKYKKMLLEIINYSVERAV
ncbi:MAG: polyprenyl synthetase family protein [Rickettsiales bacterium]|nr:polyprenyl synthetase family protein [Rickettsiales bacterium]